MDNYLILIIVLLCSAVSAASAIVGLVIGCRMAQRMLQAGARIAGQEAYLFDDLTPGLRQEDTV
jgi:hypothetical protein